MRLCENWNFLREEAAKTVVPLLNNNKDDLVWKGKHTLKVMLALNRHTQNLSLNPHHPEFPVFIPQIKLC